MNRIPLKSFLIFLFFALFMHLFFPFLEEMLYNRTMVLKKKFVSDNIVIVGVDSKTIKSMGSFPWPRNHISDLLRNIVACNPATIATDFIYAKRKNDLAGTENLRLTFAGYKHFVAGMRMENVSDRRSKDIVNLSNLQRLSRIMIVKNKDNMDDYFPYFANDIDIGDSSLVSLVSRFGFLNVAVSRDNMKVSKLINVIGIGNDYFPSFGLSAVSEYLKLKPSELSVDGNGFLNIGNCRIKLNRGDGTFRINFNGPSGTIKTISAIDVINGDIDRSELENKLVFVGITDAPELPSDFFITPVGVQFPGVELWATFASNIVDGRWFRTNCLVRIINLLVMFIIFPGLAIIGKVDRRIVIPVAIFLGGISIVAGVFLASEYFILWNSGIHVYAVVGFIVFVALNTKEVRVVERKDLNIYSAASFDLGESIPSDIVLTEIPQSDTSNYITSKLVSSVSGDVKSAVLNEFSRFPSGRIVKYLGAGGMADVYMLRNDKMEVFRAVKIIKPGQDDSWLARFDTEIKIFSELSHQNIIQCYGTGEWFGLPYIEMEFIDGLPLDEIIKNIQLTIKEVLAIGILICKALDSAHNSKVTIYGKEYEGIVHRDLKPANIMFSKKGRIKLMDFGIARPEEFTLHTMDANKIVGTIPYLAPEQLTGGHITPLVDIYALGATLYEMLCGRRVFDQKSVSEIVIAKKKGFYTSLEKSHLGSQLVGVIDKALSRRPEARFSSAADFELALTSIFLNMDSENKNDTPLLEVLAKRIYA